MTAQSQSAGAFTEHEIAQFNATHDARYGWSYEFPNAYTRIGPPAMRHVEGLNKLWANPVLDDMVWSAQNL